MTEYAMTSNSTNYAAEVIEVQALRTLPGLDNLVGISINGYQALVSKDTQVGDKLLVFPAECQISEAFAREHNLMRDQGGYLEANRRVRAIKLRGHVSNALALAMSDLPAVGTVFDTIDGVQIVRKYEVPVKVGRTPTAQPRKERRVDERMFPQHVDTENYWRNAHKIPDGGYVTVTQKLHGCFNAAQPVSLWGGGTRKISALRVGDVVVGFNVDGNIVPSIVEKVFTTGKTALWRKLTFSLTPASRKRPTTYSTPEHLFWSQRRGWVRADTLEIGETVESTLVEPWVSSRAKSVITGLLLGDGSISGHRRGAIEWSHKIEHVDYVRYVQHLLGDLSGFGPLQRRTSGYGTVMVCARTRELTDIARFVAPWERLCVPDNLEFDPLSLAIWYMDDGSLSHSEKQEDRANFAICRYDEHNAKVIRDALVRYGFVNPVLYCSERYWRIRLNKDDAERLFRDIRSHVPPVMQYKLPEYHRGFFVALPPINESGPISYAATVTSSSAVSARDAQYSTKWDIQTSTGNFYASHVLVHNSSWRATNAAVKRKLSWLERLAKRLGVKVTETEYVPLFGSRKVIKDPTNPDQNHYYSTDLWTEYGMTIADRLPKDVVVYGELVGWVNDGPIQQNYTYDVPKGQVAMYVYRVTTTTTDGHHYDLPWHDVEKFCEERGFKTVPVLWAGLHKDFVVDEFVDKVFWPQYANAVPLSKDSPVDEGVVVRYNNEFYKAKGPIFFGHETALLDKGLEILS